MAPNPSISPQLNGIHHVTAMCGDPQANINFYSGILGLRLVKVTVNYDDPGTYHLYYGDGRGTAGTSITFFPWPGASRGVIGNGQVGTTAFSVPNGSQDFWIQRLNDAGAPFYGPIERDGDEVLQLVDPDDMPVELVFSATADPRDPQPWGEIPAEAAIRGFHSVGLFVNGYEHTARLLTDQLGFRATTSDAERFRYVLGEGAPGQIVDVYCLPGRNHGRTGSGAVHHVAFRVSDDESLEAWRQRLAGAGLNVTPFRDRTYFHSIYFREPGGVLFEFATDGPGFDHDEPETTMGQSLVLPAWLEPMRDRIVAQLPAFTTFDGVEFPHGAQ